MRAEPASPPDSSPRPDAEVEAELAAAMDGARGRLAAQLARVPLPLDAEELAATLTAGKRVRGRALLLAARALGDPDPDAGAAAAALELLHAASLVHDDLIDGSPLRRGRPSVQAAAGGPAAILVGDLLVAEAFATAAPLGGPAVALLARAFAELCEGQLMEAALDWGPDAQPRIEAYAARKTGALFAAAFELGAAAAGCGAALAGRCAEAGRRLGVAFQLRDDLHDIRGDASELGKEAGADLRNGVPTLPLWIALRRLGDGGAGAPDPGRLAAAAASEAVHHATARRIAELVAEARALLVAAPSPELLEPALRAVVPDAPPPPARPHPRTEAS